MTRARDVADIVPGDQTSFRNVIINGAMKIDQRNNGASIAIANSINYTYGPDRWFAAHQSVSAGGTFTRFSNGTGDTTYYTRLTTSAGTVGFGKIGQRIEAENSRHLAGKTVTLSFYAAANTTVTWSVSYANTTDSFGTGDSPTVTSIATGNITVGSSFGSRYSTTFTVPSAATTGLQVTFASQTINGYRLDIANVQLEIGSVATPFENRPMGTELALCQRYYETGQARLKFQNNDTLRSSHYPVPYKVTKRSSTVAVTGATTSPTNVTVATMTAWNEAGGHIEWQASSGVDYQATVTWTASAEL